MTDQTPTARRSRPGAPVREKPSDFRVQFTRLGWAVVDYYSTSWKVVSRWVDEEGRQSLRADRRAYRQMLALRDKCATVVINTQSPVIPADLIAHLAEQAASRALQFSRLRA